MVLKNGFEIQLLDSNKVPLREYTYTGEPSKDDNKQVDITDVYVEVPSPDKDQTFSILIKNINNNDGPEHFFIAEYDGIESATGESIIAPKKEKEITDIGLRNKDSTNYVYHKSMFENLPVGFEDDSDSAEFGKIGLIFYSSRTVLKESPTIVDCGTGINDFLNRKRPYSMVDQDTADSTGTSTPSTVCSGKKQKLKTAATSEIAKYAKSHCIGLGGLTRTVRDTSTAMPVDDITYKVFFHYRSKNALRHLGVIPGGPKGSPADGAILLEAIEKLEKQKNAQKIKVEGEEDDESDEDDDSDSTEALCKKLRDMVNRLLD